MNTTDVPRNKVELHIHLDCSVRISTIWELLQKKRLYPQYKTLEELREACIITKASTLCDFLKPAMIIHTAIEGDEEAIERIAYELCEDQAKEGVLYFEARYSPHLLCSAENGNRSLSLDKAVQLVNKGLKRGEADFKIKARSILCCIRGYPEWSEEVLDLCDKYRNEGVLGIDIAGDEASNFASPTDIEVYKRAKDIGVHRTVHAGEAGPASNVNTAVKEMCAERIGHGYHVLEDPRIYNEALASRIHFETCPYSSYLTGSVSKNVKHPIVIFAEDNANFSINKDDTTLIGKTLDNEYNLLRKLGLEEVHLKRANFNAAMSSFLPENEKKELLNELKKVYGDLEEV